MTSAEFPTFGFEHNMYLLASFILWFSCLWIVCLYRILRGFVDAKMYGSGLCLVKTLVFFDVDIQRLTHSCSNPCSAKTSTTLVFFDICVFMEFMFGNVFRWILQRVVFYEVCEGPCSRFVVFYYVLSMRSWTQKWPPKGEQTTSKRPERQTNYLRTIP